MQTVARREIDGHAQMLFDEQLQTYEIECVEASGRIVIEAMSRLFLLTSASGAACELLDFEKRRSSA
jgi:hypothetical protein